MKKQEGDLKAYLGVDAVFKGTLNFSGIVRMDGRFEGKVITNDTLIVGETGERVIPWANIKKIELSNPKAEWG